MKLIEEYLLRITAPDAGAVINVATVVEEPASATDTEKVLQAKIAHLQRENTGLKKKDALGKPKGECKHGDKGKSEANPTIPLCKRVQLQTQMKVSAGARPRHGASSA